MTPAITKLQAFISDMNWTNEEAIAQFHYVLCVEPKTMSK